MRMLLVLCAALVGCSERPLVPSGESPDGGAPNDLAARTCGTRGGADCPAGFFCELSNQCGADDSGGTCVLVPTDCSGESAKQPVCGCDGQTYSNDCLRRQAATSLAHPSACTPPDPCTAVGGYCAMGDLIEPTCKVGFSKSASISMTGVCGLGICCVPNQH